MHFPSTNKLIPQSWENQPARSMDVRSGEAVASAAANRSAVVVESLRGECPCSSLDLVYSEAISSFLFYCSQ